MKAIFLCLGLALCLFGCKKDYPKPCKKQDVSMDSLRRIFDRKRRMSQADTLKIVGLSYKTPINQNIG
ncbi:hypothetical protein [Pedobacter zeae]|uniref:Uncharacterized protein n=1 Tax=Pedobacter zeae TaxID=1737356 RepID=A0A7W6P4C7_9SPHI|nr:hypothetical protein [Pedobacter zeae]MBB4106643.1 hypothetical protein [Pedobacter zeae]